MRLALGATGVSVVRLRSAGLHCAGLAAAWSPASSRRSCCTTRSPELESSGRRNRFLTECCSSVRGNLATVLVAAAAGDRRHRLGRSVPPGAYRVPARPVDRAAQRRGLGESPLAATPPARAASGRRTPRSSTPNSSGYDRSISSIAAERRINCPRRCRIVVERHQGHATVGILAVRRNVRRHGRNPHRHCFDWRQPESLESAQ